VSFDISRIGRWSDEFEHHVEAEQVKAYAAATNDDNPLHTAGTIAPPGFASVPVLLPLFAAIEAFVLATRGPGASTAARTSVCFGRWSRG